MNRESIQEQFGAHAADYVTSSIHARGSSLSRLVELVPAQPGWRAIDVATGAGHTAFAFAPHVAHMWATDITDEMLAATRQGAAERGLDNVTVEFADAEALPYEDGHFDLVTCRIAAHHFVDVNPFMQEARRVLRPGGLLAVVDNVVPAGAAGDYVNAFEKLRDPSHGRCLSMEEWLDAFGAHGLALQHAETVDKPVRLEVWAARHDAVMQAYLSAMLSEIAGAPAAFLRPKTDDAGTLFHLREGILIGQRSSPS